MKLVIELPRTLKPVSRQELLTKAISAMGDRLPSLADATQLPPFSSETIIDKNEEIICTWWIENEMP